jgi:hypothetical protein
MLDGVATPSQAHLYQQQQQQHHQHHQQQHYHQVDMVNEDGMVMVGDSAHNVWDLDGMLWSNLPDGLDMPFDGVPMEYDETGGHNGLSAYDHHYGMQQ